MRVVSQKQGRVARRFATPPGLTPASFGEQDHGQICKSMSTRTDHQPWSLDRRSLPVLGGSRRFGGGAAGRSTRF